MRRNDFITILQGRSVIPAARNEADFVAAMATSAPMVFVLFGNIQSLPRLLEHAAARNKLPVIHLDLIEGVGRDRSGIKYLAQIGVKAVISTKQFLAKVAREEGLLCVQRLFLLDSDALKSGIELLHSFKPDALEVLPGSVPRRAIEQLAMACNIPIIAGGLIYTAEDVAAALQNGVCAISTSQRSLWEISIK